MPKAGERLNEQWHTPQSLVLPGAHHKNKKDVTIETINYSINKQLEVRRKPRLSAQPSHEVAG